MKMKLLLVGILATILTGCTPSCVRNAYVQPMGSCGYVVYVGGLEGRDTPLSRCMSLNLATDLAATINKDMANKWSGNIEP